MGFAARGGKADWKKSFRDVFPGACEKANFAVDPRWFAAEPGEVGNCVAGTDVYDMRSLPP